MSYLKLDNPAKKISSKEQTFLEKNDILKVKLEFGLITLYFSYFRKIKVNLDLLPDILEHINNSHNFILLMNIIHNNPNLEKNRTFIVKSRKGMVTPAKITSDLIAYSNWKRR